MQRIAVNIDKRARRRIGHDWTPFKIARPQPGACVVNLQIDKLVERHLDQPGGMMARLDQMGEQRSLPALESLQQEGPPQLIKIAIRLGPKRFLEGQSRASPALILSAYICSPSTTLMSATHGNSLTALRMSSAIKNEKFAAHQ